MSPFVVTGQIVQLEQLDDLGASPIDDRDLAYWGCDPFDVVAIIEEELGMPLALLPIIRKETKS
jgi:hypothetical protein